MNDERADRIALDDGRRQLQRDLGLSSGLVLIISIAAAFVIGTAVFAGIRMSQTAGRISIVEADVGDCFVLPIEAQHTEITQIETIDCDRPHNVEVIETGELNPEGTLEYPDDELLLDIVDVTCGDPRRFHDLGFGVLPVAPNRMSWEQASGTYVCLALWMDSGLVSGRKITGAGVSEPV